MKSYAPAPYVFHTTASVPCPYLPDQLERKIVTDLKQGDPVRFHDVLSQAGFRRSHSIAYIPACPGCSACIPVRVDVKNHCETRSFRRIRRINADLRHAPCSPSASGEQHRLFLRYQNTRHGGGDMAAMTYAEYRAMIEDSPIHTLIYEFRNPQDQLMAAVLTDIGSDGLSAVYSFYEPNMPQRSLGTYIVLVLIDACRTLSLPYLYLGYWVKGCRKMSYKDRFQPLEKYGPDGWSQSNE